MSVGISMPNANKFLAALCALLVVPDFQLPHHVNLGYYWRPYKYRPLGFADTRITDMLTWTGNGNSSTVH